MRTQRLAQRLVLLINVFFSPGFCRRNSSSAASESQSMLQRPFEALPSTTAMPEYGGWNRLRNFSSRVFSDGIDGGRATSKYRGSLHGETGCKCLKGNGLNLTIAAVNIRTVSHEWFV